MKNTKANRIKFLRKQFELLGKKGNLLKAANDLNNALSKKRQVVIIRRLSELRSELRSELWSEFLYKTWEYFENNWPLFVNEFYPQLKVLQKNKNKIEALKAIVEAGNAYIWINKKKLYVLPFPEIYLDDNKRFHNTKDYALKFADKKTYWLFGVKFETPLWSRVTKGLITAKEILGLENMEQRMAALKVFGAEKLLEELKAKLVN